MARVIGLTGGIASGKSTVARILAQLGAPVVDADELARRVVAPGAPALAEIVARFGEDVIGSDGALDRKRLGQIVFADPAARRDIDAITHPRIAALSREEIARHIASGASVVVYEAALIVENQLHRGLNGLIVVAVPEAVQRARLMARDDIDEVAAAARIAAQLPLSAKIAVADFVIDNAGDADATTRQVEALWDALRAQEAL